MEISTIDEYVTTAIMAEASLEKVKFCARMIEIGKRNIKTLRQELTLTEAEFNARYGINTVVDLNAAHNFGEFIRIRTAYIKSMKDLMGQQVQHMNEISGILAAKLTLLPNIEGAMPDPIKSCFNQIMLNCGEIKTIVFNATTPIEL